MWGDDTLSDKEKERIALETTMYHFRQFIAVVELWLAGKAKITDVKAAKEASKVVLNKINKLGQTARGV